MSNANEQENERIKANEDSILQAYRQTERYSIILFIALMILLSIGIAVGVLFDHDPQVQSILLSTAVSLIVSLVFTIFFTLIVDRARSQSESRSQSIEITEMKKTIAQTVASSTADVTSYVEKRINILLEEEATRLVDKWPELLPADFFPESEESNPRFAEKLHQAVKITQHYIFRGSTARYVPGLLHKFANPNLQCDILIIDPEAVNAIRVHALDRYAIRADSRTIEQHEAEQREQIFTAIVGLFDLRHLYRIEIRTCSDTLFYRSEIMDEGMFVSFYKSGRKVKHPPTYFYKKGTIYYEAFNNDFQQSWDFAMKKFPMTRDSTEEQLRRFLVELGVNPSSLDERLTEWRDKAKKLMERG